MSYLKHRTLIITCHCVEDSTLAKAKAVQLLSSKKIDDTSEEDFLPLLSDTVVSIVNGYYSFFIAPDGSKENWPESNRFDLLMTEYLNWLDGKRKESFFIDYAYISFGGDDKEVKTLASNE